ncbi:MAG TPA: (E)-4-hydroxy-3-methylbut-2-enyl-diphosphate synthase [Opitutus sp.]|nr:(E)-4-hydroxy-3-methylbut-2-enyl-diphosphate synthase [Opitutus sp.]
MSYCQSRFHTVRRPTVEVKVGAVGVGGDNPVRIQSMTTSDTQDIAATVQQSIALAEVGCEIVRITAPNVAAAQCLKAIRTQITAAGFGHIPLVADIHFLPSAAMEAVEHVEKVRVNPGNYADKKKFAVREYSDADYNIELQRLHDAFSPLVLRAKALGRSLRIGTNHGSLSDRIMNRYGDTPLGMVESALEFLRIAESNGFKQLILSMKSSNPKVMIQAYRLLVERMQQEAMHYPLHLGVTEAGDGEDGRIKSAIGIGSLLLDGLGDTIRVSLTEDSVYEIPVARAIADKAMSSWNRPIQLPPTATTGEHSTDSLDPYHFARRASRIVQLGTRVAIGPEHPPAVITRIHPADLTALPSLLVHPQLKDTPMEGLLVAVESAATLDALPRLSSGFYALELSSTVEIADLKSRVSSVPAGSLLVRSFGEGDAALLAQFVQFAHDHQLIVAAEIAPAAIPVLGETLRKLNDRDLIFTLSTNVATAGHAIGAYRQLAEALRQIDSRAPLWIRNTAATAVQGNNTFLSKLLEASFLTGALLCDGLGEIVSIETEVDSVRATKLVYNVLQGAGARISKTEFVACPSCGRTLFDLQTTTQRIRAQTGHLKGVKLAIMGCIVNGPGEMADADFGYVGGAPGKINLYVGKQCVQYNIPQAEADAHLIALIKTHGKWVDPEPVRP